MYWIRSAVKRNQIFQSRIVTVPPRLFENHKRIGRVQTELTQKLERMPTKQELGQAVGMSEIQIDRCMSAMEQQCYSLDQAVANPLKPMNSNSEQSMYELVEAKTDESDGSTLEQRFLREDLIETMRRHLTEDEVNLLRLRYGLCESMPRSLKNGPLTIAEVSKIVGLKPDKVRRILNKSLKQLKVVIGKEWIDYERDLQ
jgi:RNA polymerase primary sigma factor